MKVSYVIPTHFDNSSVIAGAERYAYELASAMSKKVETSLVTFADKNAVCQNGELLVRYYKRLFHVGGVANPFSLGFLKDLKGTDVIHCLQFRTIVTEMAILFGGLIKKKVFVTDLGGGVRYNLSSVLPVWKAIQGFLPISEYNRSGSAGIPVQAHIIYGGVDANRFCPGDQAKEKNVLHVGRIFPLKGIHDLIASLPHGVSLEVIGQSHDDEYISRLKAMGAAKKVSFRDDLSDAQMIEKYKQAIATVIPTLVDGGFTTAMESMACGTPVIATRVGSLPEIVDDGLTGFIVPPNNPAAIREKIEYINARPDIARAMGKRGRETVLNKFTWDAVAERCLKAYSLTG